LADIEGFAAYNAKFGDEQGDACLKSVAAALRAAAGRPTDVLGRYAGGQFALLLPNTDSQGVARIAQRAMESVHGLDKVALWMGGGCRDPSRSTAWEAAADAVPNDLIAAAEQALRTAKSAGDHQVRLIDVVDLGHPDASPRH
jgi:diguanylate cyclase (GGDEF)-like protein